MNNAGKKALGFLKAKGLLLAPEVPAQPSVKLDLRDTLDYAYRYEPRILEVLPAALLHFPKTFLHTEALPKDLALVVDRIKQGEKDGPDYKGIRYQDMRRWAHKRLPDDRTVPLSERRVMKSFRLRPQTVSLLRIRARNSNRTETQVIEDLLAQLSE